MSDYKTSLFVILLAACLSSSCTLKTEESGAGVIDIEKSVGKYSEESVGKYFSTIDYIHLETNDSSVLGNITRICYEKGLYFVADDNNVCKIFDSSGKYLRTLNHIGRGPGEYLTISDMYVSPASGNIMIMDYRGEITEYDSYGLFIRKIPPPVTDKNFLGFTLVNKDLIAASIYEIHLEDGNSEGGYIIYDTCLNIRKQYTQKSGRIEIKGKEGDNKIYTVKTDPFVFSRLTDKITLTSNSTDTLFLLNNELDLSPWYIFRFGRYTADPAGLAEKTIDDNSPVITKYFSFYEIGSNLFFTLKMRGVAPEPYDNRSLAPGIIKPTKNTNVYAIFNRDQKSLTLLKQPCHKKPGLNDDIKGGPPFWPRFVSSSYEMINYYSALELILLQEETGTEFNGLSEIIKDLREADNPVIVIAK